MSKIVIHTNSEDDLPVTYHCDPEQGVFDLSEAGLPEIPVFALTRYSSSTASIGAHQHVDCLEIGLCLRGALTLRNKGQEYSIMPGDLFINKPEDIHCLTTSPKNSMVYWILIHAPQKKKPFLRLTPDEAGDVWERLNQLPCHIIAKSDAVKHAFRQLLKYQDQAQDLWRTIGLINSCTTIIMEVVNASSSKGPTVHPQLIEQLVNTIREQPEQNLTTDELARKAGLSPSLLISQFKQITGLPPYQFQLACRMEKAKTILSTTDLPITQIAFDLGFCASQHFSSHFKRAFGMTPTAWRKKHG